MPTFLSTKFDNSIANKVVTANQDLHHWEKPGTIIWKKGTKIGVATGFIDTYDDGRQYYDVYRYQDNKYYPVQVGTAIFTENTGNFATEPQNYLNDTLKNHEQIMSDLLICSGFIGKLEKKGYNCSKYRNSVISLYSKLKARNNEIKDTPYVSGVEQAYEPTLTKMYSDSLNNILNNAKIGEVATLTIIVVTAVITLSFATAAYALFKKTYSESKADLKVSDDLKRVLQNVDADTKQKILTDLESQVDKAYAQGVLDTKFSNIFGNFKNIALIAGGAFLVFKFVIPEIKK